MAVSVSAGDADMDSIAESLVAGALDEQNRVVVAGNSECPQGV